MEYQKENKKGEPTSIRFDENKVRIAFSRSGKKSKQQLVDFLIDRYVNGENPVLERQSDYSNIQQVSNSIQQPIIKDVQNPIPLNKEDIYSQLILEAETLDDFKRVYTAIEKDVLHFKIKSSLYELLAQMKEKKGFIYND